MSIVFVNPDVIPVFNILVRKNQDTVLLINAKNGSNVALDLTGATISMDVREQPYMTGNLHTNFSTTTGGGIVVATDPTTGSFTLTILESAASGYTWKHGYFDVKVTFGGGQVLIIGKGEIQIEDGITV